MPSVGHLPHAVPGELCQLLLVLYSHRNDGSMVQRHCPNLPHKAVTSLMHPTAAKKSRGNSVWFLFNSEEVKNQTHSFTLGHCLGFAPPCSSLCFLLRASPALCALIGPSPPPSLAYLAFLQGLGSAGAFHSHQSRLFPLEKAKFLFCRTKCNAV